MAALKIAGNFGLRYNKTVATNKTNRPDTGKGAFMQGEQIMRCNVINFKMRTRSDNTYEDRFCHNKSDAKGTLEFLGERVYVELDVTQKIAGDYLGGTIYFSAGEYTGDVMMDFMCNTAVNIYKGNEVIFRHYDRHWRFPDDGLDDVTSDYKIHNPAIDWIKENYGGFCYSTLSYADDCSKKCPDVRWEIYNTCDDSWASVNWTVTNLIRTAENDGYECDATAYFESNGRKIEREESEPCFHVVTLDKDPINAMKVIYNGEHLSNIEGPGFDSLCEAFLNYIDLCDLGYGEC